MMTGGLRVGLGLLVPVVIIASWASSCSDDKDPTTPGDTTAPGAIVTLAAGNSTVTSIQLTWTATGDNGSTGTASQYDIRYSTAAITAANFASATAVTGAPIPTPAGTSQQVTISGLAASTTYHFAMKPADEVPNWSLISNLPTASTLPTPDVTAPDAVGDLTTDTVTPTSLRLIWAAPGDNGSIGTAARYDIRISTTAITLANFASAAVLTDAPTPTEGGSFQHLIVSGLNPDTNYHFAMKTADEVPNWSILSNVPNVSTLPAPDVTAPDAIGDLSADTVTMTSLRLTWTAPGDNGSIGTAAQYDIRYSTTPITSSSFGSATPVTGVPTPTAAGTTQHLTVNGLTPGTNYHLAMMTADEAPNWSTLSNLPTVATQTPSDTTPPVAVGDLGATAIDLSRVVLTWTAPGDDGAVGSAHQYDIRYSTSMITEALWTSALQVAGEPNPTGAGSAQVMVVPGLLSNTQYFFVIKSTDEMSNRSAISNSASAQTP